MRIFAIDCSGSTETYAQRMLDDVKRRSTSARDGVVFFSHRNVSRGQLVNEATLDGVKSMGGDGVKDLLEWMDSRSLHSSDELIIYHDGMFDWGLLGDIEDARWDTKFVLVNNCLRKEQFEHFSGLILDVLCF